MYTKYIMMTLKFFTLLYRSLGPNPNNKKKKKTMTFQIKQFIIIIKKKLYNIFTVYYHYNFLSFIFLMTFWRAIMLHRKRCSDWKQVHRYIT